MKLPTIKPRVIKHWPWITQNLLYFPIFFFRISKQQTLNENFSKLDTLKKELFILGDFNIDMYQNENLARCKRNILVSETVFNDVKNYPQFYSMVGLTQITKSPTLITCSSASLTDYISGSLFEAISQNGVINVDLSDYELIYCTRKISTIKTGGTDKELKSRLLKNARLMLIKML